MSSALTNVAAEPSPTHSASLASSGKTVRDHPRIALIGDYSLDVLAHRAIPRALELAKTASGADITWQWVHTRDLHDAPRDLASFAAVWVVPASPYANMTGVLAAIRFARETRRPFLGTC